MVEENSGACEPAAFLFGFSVGAVDTVITYDSNDSFPIWEALEYNKTGETSRWESNWGYVKLLRFEPSEGGSEEMSGIAATFFGSLFDAIAAWSGDTEVLRAATRGEHGGVVSS